MTRKLLDDLVSMSKLPEPSNNEFHRWATLVSGMVKNISPNHSLPTGQLAYDSKAGLQYRCIGIGDMGSNTPIA